MDKQVYLQKYGTVTKQTIVIRTTILINREKPLQPPECHQETHRTHKLTGRQQLEICMFCIFFARI